MQSVRTARKKILKRKPLLVYADTVFHQNESDGFCMIIAVKSGTAVLDIDENTVTLEEGDIVTVNGGVKYKLSGGDESALLFLCIDNLHVATLPLNKITPAPYCVIKAISKLKTVCALIETLSAENANKPLYETVEYGALSTVIAIILRLTDNEKALYSERANYDKVKIYFDENFLTIDSVDEVCKTLGVNKFYLSRVFKEQIGVTPAQYLIKKRMDLAKNYLEKTEMNICDIAKECGYKDPGYFCRVFKKQCKITPLHHRYLFKLGEI